MTFFKSLLGKTGWKQFSNNLIEGLKQNMGRDNFVILTRLANKYGLFNYIHKFMQSPKPLPIEFQERKLRGGIVMILTDLCSKLGQTHISPPKQIIEDMEASSKLALCLQSEHYPARANLSILYYNIGRVEEARKHAKRAIADMDKEKERDKSIPENIQKHIQKLVPNGNDANHNLRELLLRIAEEID